MPSVMLLSCISKRLILAVGILVSIGATAHGEDVCDAHLSRIKVIPFESNAGVDSHYDALKAAGKSAVRCLIENVTDTRPKPDPRSIPHWGTVVTTVGDTAVFMLEEITGVEVIKMLPRSYQRRYKEIGVYACEEYLHDGHNHRRILQRKLRRWYSTTYLRSLRKAQHNKALQLTAR